MKTPNHQKRNRRRFSLINVALGLTVAVFFVDLIAAHLLMPIDQKGMLAMPQWHILLILLSWHLPVVACAAWIVVIGNAIHRRRDGYEGY